MPIDYRIPEDIKALILSYETTAAVKNHLNAHQKQWFESIGTTPYIVRWYINHNLTSMDGIRCCNCGAPIIYHKNNQYSLENIDLNHCYCSVACSAKDPVKQQRMKQTNLKRYGCEHVTQNKTVYNKKRATEVERYGEDYGKVLRAKASKTNLERYGATNAFNAPSKQQQVIRTHRSNFYSTLIDILNDKRYQLVTDYQTYLTGTNDLTLRCIDCGKIKQIHSNRYHHIRICDCHTTSTSEKQLAEVVRSMYSGKFVVADRSILNGKELDIVLPDNKVAIEFNGCYWHSTKFRKDPLYHQQKSLLCAEKGFCLYQIYEDQWVYNRDNVITKLKALINHTCELPVDGIVDLDYNIIPILGNVDIKKIIEPHMWYVYYDHRYDVSSTLYQKNFLTLYDSGKAFVRRK